MATPRFLKKAMASSMLQWIVSAIGATYVILVKWTGRTDSPPPPDQGPYIIAMWHGRISQLHYLRAGHAPLVALISAHRDGQLISKCAWHFGIATVTGSTRKHGTRAVRELIRLAGGGRTIFITPDGPRGPRMRVNRGVLELARITGHTILPAAISTSRAIMLNTWDRFMVPLPFSRTVVRWGEPMSLSNNDEVACAGTQLEVRLTALQEEADRAVGREPVTAVQASIVAKASTTEL